jgi:hypothetical protein
MTAPIFSEVPSAVSPPGHDDMPATPPARAPLQDGRTDFNVVFIHSRLDDYGLPPAEFRVYAHIARRAGSREAFPAVKSVARVCRLHPQTVRRALGVLVKHRLIRREGRPGQTAVYRLTQASEWQPPTHIIGHPYEKDTPPSVSQDTPPKRMQGYPSEKDGAEGNPVEGDPPKKQTQATSALSLGLPRNEDEAIEQARLVGVPPEFARVEFCRLESVGWVNGAGNPVRKWVPHLRKRWADDQSQRAERKAHAAARPGRASGYVPPRKFDSTNYQQPVEEF